MNFIQPAVGQTVTIPTIKLRVVPGMTVFHRHGGYYRVVTYSGGFSITLRNLGLSQNPNPGSVIDTDDTALLISGEPGISVVETPYTGSRCDNKMPTALGVQICVENHGFQAGDVLISSETPGVDFVLASASTEAGSFVAGIVQFVINDDKFVLLTGGLLRLFPDAFPVWAPDGLEKGKIYYLSDVPGQLSLTPGTIERPVLLSYTQTLGFFSAYDGGAIEFSNDPTTAIGTDSPGTSDKAARSDHSHLHGNQGRGSQHQVATTGENGFMASTDKSKLDGISPGATANNPSNATPSQVSSTVGLPGTAPNFARGDHSHQHGDLEGGTLHALVTTLIAGFMSAADKSKLDGFIPGAANNLAQLGPDSKLRDDQIPTALLGGLVFQSTWNAATNTPTVPAAAVGNKGHYYLVSVEGNTNLDGITDWKMGDWAVSIGTSWIKVDNTDHVVSVAGKQGVITLDIADIIGLQAALDLKANITDVNDALALKAPIAPGWNEQSGTSYTPVITDIGKTIRLSNANPITFTIPNDTDLDFPIGSILEICQGDAGKVQIVGDTGVDVDSFDDLDTTVGKDAAVTIKKRAANTWWAVGQLE